MLELLPEWLILVITFFLIPISAQIIKWGADKFGWEIHRNVIKWVVYALSGGIAYFVVRPILPPIDDPAVFIPALILAARGIQEFAQKIYDLWLSGLFERIGFAPDFQLEG